MGDLSVEVSTVYAGAIAVAALLDGIAIGIVSIVLAIVSMVTTSLTEKRIIQIVKTIRKLIDGKDDET